MDSKPKVPRRTRPVTASYLRNAALHYLTGRDASVAMVRSMLVRRARRRLDVRLLDEITHERITQCLSELVTLGLVDDKRFAERRADGLRRKGLSGKRIGLQLKQKGIEPELVAAARGDVDDLEQARIFAARKRLGPWRPGGTDRARREKDLRMLARAGFGFQAAVRALAEDEEDVGG